MTSDRPSASPVEVADKRPGETARPPSTGGGIYRPSIDDGNPKKEERTIHHSDQTGVFSSRCRQCKKHLTSLHVARNIMRGMS